MVSLKNNVREGTYLCPSDGAMMTPKMQYILPYNLHLEWLISSNWEKVITFCKALHPNAFPTVRPR